jgi:hypothetical protein
VKRLDTPRNGQRIGTCRSRSGFKLVGIRPESGRKPDNVVPTFSFQKCLRALGYRTHTTPSTDKLGVTQLATEAHARGW